MMYAKCEVCMHVLIKQTCQKVKIAVNGMSKRDLYVTYIFIYVIASNVHSIVFALKHGAELR